LVACLFYILGRRIKKARVAGQFDPETGVGCFFLASFLELAVMFLYPLPAFIAHRWGVASPRGA
jgi:hypothetical protein